jgi:hypothetical protein
VRGVKKKTSKDITRANRKNKTLNVENCLLWFARNPLLDFVQLKAVLIAKIVNLLVYLLDGDFHLVRDRLNRRDSLIAIFVFAEIFIPQALVDLVEGDEILRLLSRPIVLRHRLRLHLYNFVCALREQKMYETQIYNRENRENENKRKKTQRGLSDTTRFV